MRKMYPIVRWYLAASPGETSFEDRGSDMTVRKEAGDRNNRERIDKETRLIDASESAKRWYRNDGDISRN